MDYTIVGLINGFRDVALSFVEIATFNFGFDFDINNQKRSERGLCQIWVQPLTSQLVMGNNGSRNRRRFRIYCYDLVNQSESNQISVWNQTESILIDYVRWFKYSNKVLRVVNDPVLIPFKESFAEDMSGYYTDVEIETPELTGYCFMPTK